jgi:hypothetical protein
MAVEHASLTGADLHEPKGAASANAGEFYKADGAGSGAWKKSFGYGEMTITGYSTATAFTSSNTMYKISSGWTVGSTSGMTFATDTLTVVTPGVWEIMCLGSILSTSTLQTFSFDFGKNGTAQGKTVDISINSTAKTAFHTAALMTLAAADTITFMVKNVAATGSATVTDAKFIAKLVTAT